VGRQPRWQTVKVIGKGDLTHQVPALDGLDNTFTLRNLEEMRNALLSRHESEGVDQLIEELNKFGSAEFSVG